MRVWVVAGVGVVLAGCMTASWPALRGNRTPGTGRAVMTGRITLVPPVTRADESRRVETWLLFTDDLDEPWRPSRWVPLREFESTTARPDGTFFAEVPAPATFYLRGVLLAVGNERSWVEVPARVRVPGAGSVVYIGHLRVVRTGGERLVVRDEMNEAKKSAREWGLAGLRGLRWKRALAKPAAVDTDRGVSSSRPSTPARRR